MAGASAIRAGAAFVELLTDATKFDQGLNKAAAKLKAWGAGITNLGAKAFAAGAAITTPLLMASKLFGETGSELLHMSQRTGIGVESLSALGFAAGQVGIDMEQLERSLKFMEKTIGGAGAGSQEAAGHIQKLGLTVQQLVGKSPEQPLRTISDAMSKIGDPAQRAATATGA